MNNGQKINIHLILIIIMLTAGAWWTFNSWYVVYFRGADLFNIWFIVQFSDVDPMWFSRSGAVLVCIAVVSSLITRPSVENIAAPDYLNIVEHALGEAEKKKEHWASKIKLSKILSWLELSWGVVGTLIWAYGDLWLK